MSFRIFKITFDETLHETPLPYGHVWKFQPLRGAIYRDKREWFEVLYRTRASYCCKSGHHWASSWTMILFCCHLDSSKGIGRVRMKRFGQSCAECKDDSEYFVGKCDKFQVWSIVQRLLLHILLKCYEQRRDCDIDIEQYVIPVSDVPYQRSGGRSGQHQKSHCEACANNRCQEIYTNLTKKK